VQQAFQRKVLNFGKDGEKFFMVPPWISCNHEITGATVLEAVNELMRPVTKDYAGFNFEVERVGAVGFRPSGARGL
jgi:hypothetical protein